MNPFGILYSLISEREKRFKKNVPYRLEVGVITVYLKKGSGPIRIQKDDERPLYRTNLAAF